MHRIESNNRHPLARVTDVDDNRRDPVMGDDSPRDPLMGDTAAAIAATLRSLAARLTALHRARLLTLDGNPASTNAAVHQALRLLDQAVERIADLETLDP